MEDIRAITVGGLWAYSIVVGAKRVENRSWNTSYRGPLLVHAGARIYEGEAAEVDAILVKQGFSPTPEDVYVSAFVGLVTLVDVVHDGAPGKWAKDPWFCGPYGFVLSRPVMFTEPVEAKGKLGLWRPSPESLRSLAKYLRSYAQ